MSAGNLKGTETIFHSHKNADEKAEHIYMYPNMHYMITWIPDKSEELHSTVMKFSQKTDTKLFNKI